jgi:hypothetical protein
MLRTYVNGSVNSIKGKLVVRLGYLCFQLTSVAKNGSSIMYARTKVYPALLVFPAVAPVTLLVPPALAALTVNLDVI